MMENISRSELKFWIGIISVIIAVVVTFTSLRTEVRVISTEVSHIKNVMNTVNDLQARVSKIEGQLGSN